MSRTQKDSDPDSPGRKKVKNRYVVILAFSIDNKYSDVSCNDTQVVLDIHYTLHSHRLTPHMHIHADTV